MNFGVMEAVARRISDGDRQVIVTAATTRPKAGPAIHLLEPAQARRLPARGCAACVRVFTDGAADPGGDAMARIRHADMAVPRALARRERDPVAALRVR